MPPTVYLAGCLFGLLMLLAILVGLRHDAERRRRWNATACPDCGEDYQVGRDHAGVTFRLVSTWPDRRHWGGERTEVRHALTCVACGRTTEFHPDGTPVAPADEPELPPIDWPRHFVREGTAR